MSKLIDLTGQKFGKLTVLKKVESDKYGHTRWLCQCDCGNETKVAGYHLKDKTISSCGCYQKEVKSVLHLKHGQCRTRLYGIYNGIKKRCYNKKEKNYTKYGARGIVVCDEWLDDFMNFYSWSMANGYKDNLTIDRIDVNGNYEPNNCRWTTQKTQQNNRRDNHLITYNGKTQTLSQWASELKIDYDCLEARINRHKWSIERALTQPVKNKE